MQLTAIYACDSRGGIGYNGGLVVRSKSDINFFWKTIGQHTIIIGRKTWEGTKNLFLKKRPNAVHIVLTKSETCPKDSLNVLYVDSVERAIEWAERFAIVFDNTDDPVFVCGGAKIYEAFAPYVNKVYATVADAKKKPCDTFLPHGKFLIGHDNEHEYGFYDEKLPRLRKDDDEVTLWTIQRF